MTWWKDIADAPAEKRARGSTEEFLGCGTHHDRARFAREENQAILHSRHDGVHVFAHSADDFVPAAQLLTDLWDLAADCADFVSARDKALCFGSRHVELPSRDAIQLIGN